MALISFQLIIYLYKAFIFATLTPSKKNAVMVRP